MAVKSNTIKQGISYPVLKREQINLNVNEGIAVAGKGKKFKISKFLKNKAK